MEKIRCVELIFLPECCQVLSITHGGVQTPGPSYIHIEALACICTHLHGGGERGRERERERD